MAKPTKKKNSFDAQVQSVLANVRIVSQAASTDNQRGSIAEGASKSGQFRQPEARVVEKLIDFLKAMD